MAYEVLARKWRPQHFEDVVGQNHVTSTLVNAITSERLAHAYLFVGPRGIGKTSIARIFAKALNCVEGTTTKPCGKCDSCIEIAKGTDLDVLEIDGASNNGVEQVRDLRDSVMYAPARGKFKIYIIDEVHMLSTAAFNALLKTLEEPPPHEKFFYSTTEPDKILTTIISRCQRFDLKRIPVVEIVERLELIAKSEKVEVSDDALIAVARGAEGGLRDAESALDQLIAFRGNKIEEDDVLAVFGLVSRAGLESLAEGVLQGELKTIIKLVGEFDNAGKDLARLLAELVEHFRNLLIALNVDNIDDVMDVTPGQKKVIEAHAAQTDTAKLLRVMGVLTQALDKFRFALSQKTLLETALIKAARVATVVSLEEVLREINVLKGGLVSETKKKDEQPPVVEAPAVVAEPEETHTPAVKEAPPKTQAKKKAAGASPTLDKILEKWDEVVERVGMISVAAKGSLSDAYPIKAEDDVVTIGFEPEFAHDIDRFKNMRNRKAVEKALERALGNSVTVLFAVAPEGVIKLASERKQHAPQESAGIEKTAKHVVDDPVVQKAMEMFEGSILEVRK